ncbi:hypothetical protein BJ912DRAFT_925763 [Pholiota molesta]|nr:hypothetical protein BJ912DRAFT_925763 [Pholiota molesta]
MASVTWRKDPVYNEALSSHQDNAVVLKLHIRMSCVNAALNNVGVFAMAKSFCNSAGIKHSIIHSSHPIIQHSSSVAFLFHRHLCVRVWELDASLLYKVRSILKSVFNALLFDIEGRCKGDGKDLRFEYLSNVPWDEDLYLQPLDCKVLFYSADRYFYRRRWPASIWKKMFLNRVIGKEIKKTVLQLLQQTARQATSEGDNPPSIISPGLAEGPHLRDGQFLRWLHRPVMLNVTGYVQLNNQTFEDARRYIWFTW